MTTTNRLHKQARKEWLTKGGPTVGPKQQKLPPETVEKVRQAFQALDNRNQFKNKILKALAKRTAILKGPHD